MYQFSKTELEEYVNSYWDFTSDRPDLLWDSCYDIETIYNYIVELLDNYLAKDESVSKELKNILVHHLGADEDEENPDMSTNFMESKLFSELTILSTYYLVGFIEAKDMKDTINHQKNDLLERLKSLSKFIEFLPKHLQNQMYNIETVYNGAMGRYKLDFDENLTVKEMAALSKTKEKTIYNAIASKTLDVDDNKRITNVSAQKWLKDKIYPSKWKNFICKGICREGSFEQLIDKMDEISVAEKKEEQYYIVPVSQGNDVFNANLKRNNVYTIGLKGQEVKYENYFEALNALVQMKVPFWERPIENGNWGIVKGVYWVRKSATELGL